MPMERALYPPDWPAISLAIRNAADWRCQWCGVQCYRPGERCVNRARVLTVAHVVAISEGGGHERENLRALCAACHCRYDHPRHIARAAASRARRREQRRVAAGQGVLG